MEYWPTLQLTQLMEPAFAWKSPAVQLVQLLTPGNENEYVPAEQLTHVETETALETTEYSPAKQLKHPTDPAPAWYCPAVQLKHKFESGALSVA